METLRAIRPTDTGLIYVVWEITLRCDLACGHCGSRAGKARPDELSTAEALDLVRQIREMGAREVTLIGGEAYLRDDWHVIAKAIGEAGMACTMTTGGRNLTPERARQARDAGIRGISVSIDGMRDAHDRQRGVMGSFDSAVQAMKNVRAAGVRVTANTQVNRISYGDLDAVLDLVAEHGCDAWQVQLTVPMGRAADHPDWLLQPDDMLEVIPKIAALKLRGKALGVTLWPGNDVGYFGPTEAILRGDEKRPYGHTTGCTAGMHTLGLEANGAIKGCPSLPTGDWSGGTIREKTLREVWDTAAPLRYTRDRTVEDLWGYCRECYYADTCRAGCTWTGHVFFGRPGNNPYCHHRALEFDRRGLRERLVPVKDAPGRPFDHGVFEVVVEPKPSEPRRSLLERQGPRRLPRV